MTLLAFPSAAVLVVRVAGFDFIKAVMAYENPLTFFFDADTKQCVFLQVAARTILLTNSFDLSHDVELPFGILHRK